MAKKELCHRVERSQQELDYWSSRADEMRSVLDRLETDYLTHRTDCFLVRQRHLMEVVERALVIVDSLEGRGGGGPASDADAGSTSPSTSGRSSPTESSSLLPAPQPSSTAMAADYSRNMQRLAARSRLKCTMQCIHSLTKMILLISTRHRVSLLGIMKHYKVVYCRMHKIYK